MQIFNDVEREVAKASEVQIAIDELSLSFNLDTNGYEISSCRNQERYKLADSFIFISVFSYFYSDYILETEMCFPKLDIYKC